MLQRLFLSPTKVSSRIFFHTLKMPRRVGLIGGMSWKTTVVYYSEINKHVGSQKGGLHSANLLIKSLDYQEIAEMVTAGNFTEMTKLLCDSGHELKAAGAQGLVLCANVAHKAADALERSTDLPVLHIVDFTGREIAKNNFTKVGLLATRTVMEEDFYKNRLRDRFGVQVFVPEDSTFRAHADHDIFNEMSKQVIPEHVKSSWRTAYSKLVHDNKVDCVVLGCTELRLVFHPEDMTVPTFETTMLHAKGIADWLVGK